MTNSGNSLSTGVKPTYALSFVIALKGKNIGRQRAYSCGYSFRLPGSPKRYWNYIRRRRVTEFPFQMPEWYSGNNL